MINIKREYCKKHEEEGQVPFVPTMMGELPNGLKPDDMKHFHDLLV